MPKLPSVSGKEAIKAFEKAGWQCIRIGSSRHIIMKKPGMMTTLSIPDHKILDRGLLRSLIRDAFLSIEQFNSFLENWTEVCSLGEPAPAALLSRGRQGARIISFFIPVIRDRHGIQISHRLTGGSKVNS
jgi:predicted RNA binding protein YcfA (HicA-like mRNA interferase family)